MKLKLELSLAKRVIFALLTVGFGLLAALFFLWCKSGFDTNRMQIWVRARMEQLRNRFAVEPGRETRQARLKYFESEASADLILERTASGIVKIINGQNMAEEPQFPATRNGFKEIADRVSATRSHRQLALVRINGVFFENGQDETMEESLWELTHFLRSIGFRRIVYAVTSHGQWIDAYGEGLPSQEEIRRRKESIRRQLKLSSTNAVPDPH